MSRLLPVAAALVALSTLSWSRIAAADPDAGTAPGPENHPSSLRQRGPFVRLSLGPAQLDDSVELGGDNVVQTNTLELTGGGTRYGLMAGVQFDEYVAAGVEGSIDTASSPDVLVAGQPSTSTVSSLAMYSLTPSLEIFPSAKIGLYLHGGVGLGWLGSGADVGEHSTLPAAGPTFVGALGYDARVVQHLKLGVVLEARAGKMARTAKQDVPGVNGGSAVVDVDQDHTVSSLSLGFTLRVD